MPFCHENLIVYQRTLDFNSKVSIWTGQWDSKHAVCDQMSRAAVSMLENIAMASAAYSGMKIRSVDYAIGSSLECAACLDLVRVKRLLDLNLIYEEKERLSQTLRMLIGLRKSWAKATSSVREDCEGYETEIVLDKTCDKEWDSGKCCVCENAWSGKVLFHHETLDVYRTAISAAEMFSAVESVAHLSNPVFRRLDDLLTSMVLNIAEGNGRFSDADQTRFLGTSYESAVKLAARLDLCVTQGLLPQKEVGECKILLERVSAMTSSMVRSGVK